MRLHNKLMWGLGTTALLAAGLIFGWVKQQEVTRAELGRQLFSGDPNGAGMLRGRMVGHEEDLPVAATRCMNCHVAGAARQGQPLENATQANASSQCGTPLNARTLTLHQPRRGGPASAYDVASLCKLMRDGIDPAWVMINQSMPRYAITDSQCEALWSYLNQQ